MRTIRTKVYKFSELSKQAQEKAIEEYRSDNAGNSPNWEQENNDSLRKFCEVFPCEINRRGDGLNFTGDSNQENLKGQRLATYIWNNYKNKIYKGKYYNVPDNGNKPIYHKRVKTQTYKNGNVGNYYYSAITLDAHGCPFTGMYIDDVLLSVIIDFMNKPEPETTFEELLKDCFYAWEKATQADYEYQQSDEFIEEEIEANEYEFTKDGRRF